MIARPFMGFGEIRRFSVSIPPPNGFESVGSQPMPLAPMRTPCGLLFGRQGEVDWTWYAALVTHTKGSWIVFPFPIAHVVALPNGLPHMMLLSTRTFALPHQRPSALIVSRMRFCENAPWVWRSPTPPPMFDATVLFSIRHVPPAM